MSKPEQISMYQQLRILEIELGDWLEKCPADMYEAIFKRLISVRATLKGAETL